MEETSIVTTENQDKVKQEKKDGEIVIIAPHCDDELIGCYKVITEAKYPPVIIYTGQIDAKRRKESLKLKDSTGIAMQFYTVDIPPILVNPATKFYFPDPAYETHPEHRKWGFIGEGFARGGFDVTFYNTNMNAPYLYEVPSPDKKRELLEEVYPSQKSLWKYDHKYFLFEGYCRWIF